MNLVIDEFENSHKYPGMGKTHIYWVSSGIIEKYRTDSWPLTKFVPQLISRINIYVNIQILKFITV